MTVQQITTTIVLDDLDTILHLIFTINLEHTVTVNFMDKKIKPQEIL